MDQPRDERSLYRNGCLLAAMLVIAAASRDFWIRRLESSHIDQAAARETVPGRQRMNRRTRLPNRAGAQHSQSSTDTPDCEGAHGKLFSEPSNIELQIVRQKRIVVPLVDCLASKYR
jgi:hypothetical protein